MIASMTAFARAQVQEDWGSLVWEVRSVNHRYLEPHFRLPELLREIEPAVRDSLRQQLHRGKIECYLKLQLAETEQSFTLNQPALAALKQAVATIEQLFPTARDIDPLSVLQWPGIQAVECRDWSPVLAAACQSFEAAINQLVTMRCREGEALKQGLLERLNYINDEVNCIRTALPAMLQAQKSRLLDKLTDMQLTLAPDRLEQEWVLLAQKLDVAEELDRLAVHIGEVKRVLGAVTTADHAAVSEPLKTKSKPIAPNGAVGRRLDFLMQELNREVNTLAAKVTDASVTQNAVNLKVLIEQMREQIQNIE